MDRVKPRDVLAGRRDAGRSDDNRQGLWTNGSMVRGVAIGWRCAAGRRLIRYSFVVETVPVRGMKERRVSK